MSNEATRANIEQNTWEIVSSARGVEPSLPFIKTRPAMAAGSTSKITLTPDIKAEQSGEVTYPPSTISSTVNSK
jgi:hypothetical protein